MLLEQPITRRHLRFWTCVMKWFLVMDEFFFDMWAKKKNKYDYFSDFPEWHRKDLKQWYCAIAIIHLSLWSIGNEIREQFDATGITLTRDLVKNCERR